MVLRSRGNLPVGWNVHLNVKRATQLAVLGLSGATLSWGLPFAWGRMCTASDEQEGVRHRVMWKLASLQPASSLDLNERNWLKNTAGWSDREVDFYDRRIAIPTGRGRILWLAEKPSNWAEYCRMMDDSALSGRSFESTAMSRRGVAVYGHTLIAESTLSHNLGRFGQMFWTEEYRSQIEPIVAVMNASDYKGARETLRAVGAARTDQPRRVRRGD